MNTVNSISKFYYSIIHYDKFYYPRKTMISSIIIFS